MTFSRIMRYGDKGSDVKKIKDILFELGYYSPNIVTLRKTSFGSDTKTAVLRFQQAATDNSGKQLDVDGLVGPLTIEAILRVYAGGDLRIGTTGSQPHIPEETPHTPSALFVAAAYPNISVAHLAAISAACAGKSDKRLEVVREALRYAYDMDAGKRDYPLSIYRRGGNLYNKDLSLNIITPAKLETYLASSSYAQYTSGREEMMRAACTNQKCTGADCSGGIIGLWRKAGLIKPDADASANTLCGSGYSASVTASELLPGDLVGRDGHVGLYVGAGLVVEWVGGAFGCQLTVLADRRVYCFCTYSKYKKGSVLKYSAWTKYRRAKVY